MGKSNKDVANYHRFKNKEAKSKEINVLISLMKRSYTGLRYGDDRKSNAKDKITARRVRRCKEKEEMYRDV